MRCASRIATRPIRAIPIAVEGVDGTIQRVIQKKICASILIEASAIRPSSAALARGSERIATTSRVVRAKCRKAAFFKGFLHSRKIGDEIARRTK
jgi:hypothetical protein